MAISITRGPYILVVGERKFHAELSKRTTQSLVITRLGPAIQ